MALISIGYIHRDINRCNSSTLEEKIKTPSGKLIPKFVHRTDFQTFGNLSKECRYENQNNIICPDVRHQGETMNQQVLLTIARMLAIIDLICERHSINYWLIAGTLLGASRNNRLIPWDSDGDVGMLLGDYQHFLKHVRNELPKDLYFQDGSDDIDFRHASVVSAKIRDQNSCYGYCINKGCRWHDGIQVDIFVFLQKNDNPNTIVSALPRFEINIDDVLPTKKIITDGVSLSVPANSHTILSDLYGSNYMSIPDNACPFGKIPFPWYSCEHIKSLPLNEQKKTLDESYIHPSFLFRYII